MLDDLIGFAFYWLMLAIPTLGTFLLFTKCLGVGG